MLSRIRPANLEDCPAIAQVQVDSYRTVYADFFPQTFLDHFTYEEQTQDWRDLLTGQTRDLLYVAEIESGEIIGYALGRPGLTSIAPYDSELVALHVRRVYWRQGIGRQLLAATAAGLQAQGCTCLMLWVLAENPARAFYERLGGQLIGQQQLHLGESVTAVEVAYGWPDLGVWLALIQRE